MTLLKKLHIEGKIWQITESKQKIGRVAETKYHSKDVEMLVRMFVMAAI